MIPVPRKLRILGQTWTTLVKPVGTPLHEHVASSTVGTIEENECLMTVRAVGPGGSGTHQQLDTVLHETLHAIVYTAGLRHPLFKDSHGKEETAVSLLTPVLLDTLRSNPLLVRYLTQALP